MLAILIIPISLTGSALVWHDWLDETLNPQRYAVHGAAALPPSAYAAAAQRRAWRPASGSSRSAIPEGKGRSSSTAARTPSPAPRGRTGADQRLARSRPTRECSTGRRQQ